MRIFYISCEKTWDALGGYPYPYDCLNAWPVCYLIFLSTSYSISILRIKPIICYDMSISIIQKISSDSCILWCIGWGRQKLSFHSDDISARPKKLRLRKCLIHHNRMIILLLSILCQISLILNKFGFKVIKCKDVQTTWYLTPRLPNTYYTILLSIIGDPITTSWSITILILDRKSLINLLPRCIGWNYHFNCIIQTFEAWK